nr:PepSY domain-containing protein [Cyclobacteriaceae bacterium]
WAFRILARLPMRALYEHVRQKHPAAAYYSIDFAGGAAATLNIGVYPEADVYYNGTYYSFDQYSGALVKAEAYAQMSTGERVRAMNYDIHVGKILGLPGQVMAFIASLVGSWLPITGFLIWRGRRTKKDPKHTVHETSQIHVYQTNIATAKQVEEVAVMLRQHKEVVSWTVEPHGPNHLLRVIGKPVPCQRMAAHLRARGFTCLEREQ